MNQNPICEPDYSDFAPMSEEEPREILGEKEASEQTAANDRLTAI